jgi:hypothetical protein
MSQKPPSGNPEVHDLFPSAGPGAADAPPPPDLPPVEAPSGAFIVQLFVIPALVVLVVIAVWLLFGKLAGGERDAREYVRLLRSPDANWRAAFELASLIQNDAKLGSDPVLLGELTDLLGHDLDRNENPELTQYLALTLGAFRTLETQSPSGRPADVVAVLARALEPRQPNLVRIAAAASLAKHAARKEGRFEDERAVRALAAASDSSQSQNDPELRQMAVYALGFFGGAPATEALRTRLDDPDRFVRYNAAVALGRQGDEAARKTFREMLSSADLGKVLALPSELEKQNKIEAIEIEALQSLQTSVHAGKPALAASLRPELEALSRSGLVSVRSQSLALLRSEGMGAEPARQ